MSTKTLVNKLSVNSVKNSTQRKRTSSILRKSESSTTKKRQIKLRKKKSEMTNKKLLSLYIPFSNFVKGETGIEKLILKRLSKPNTKKG